MKSIIEKLRDDYVLLYKKAGEYLANAPKGKLSIHRKNGHTYYYQKSIGADGKRASKYLNKKDRELVCALAQKGYYENIRNNTEIVISRLMELLKGYNTEIDSIYDNLSEDRKKLIAPVAPTLSQKIDEWRNEKSLKNEEYIENLRFHTQRGELVRSKSELMIADQLFKFSDSLDYRYEQELILLDNNGDVIHLHPDFKIFSFKTGKIKYWEHFGKMDDIRYVNNFMKKISLYSLNGFVIGKDLIVTFEDLYHPLDAMQIKQAIGLLETPEWMLFDSGDDPNYSGTIQ